MTGMTIYDKVAYLYYHAHIDKKTICGILDISEDYFNYLLDKGGK